MPGKIVMQVNGRPVECRAGSSILNACLDAGIYIPNLCSHPAIASIGACRLCVVEVEGEKEPVPACTTVVEAGMTIWTETERLRALRRLAVELILSEHPEDCSSCPKFGSCPLQTVIQYAGASNGRFRSAEKLVSPDTRNPLFIHDMYRCVKCGRCVRVCRDVRGVGVMRYLRDGRGDTVVGYGADLLADAGCRFCGACVEICPTGALRDKERPDLRSLSREDALVPCRARCPAHIDVPRYIRQVREGDYAGAAATIREKTAFPGSLGYVCSRPCESACRRGELNTAVAIRELKKVAAAKGGGTRRTGLANEPPDGKRVAVVGGGPAGLSAALRLVRLGERAEVFEALPEAGGMLRYVIPEYRLTTEVPAEEIGDILEAGVILHTGCRIRRPVELLQQGFDAVLVAAGAQRGVRLSIPGAELPGVLDAVGFLREVRCGRPPELGGSVAVLGGGSVAFDCARTALRLGAERVMLLCLESEGEMRAEQEEIDAARREGVEIMTSRAFLAVAGRERASGVDTAPVSEFRFDETGALQMVCDRERTTRTAASTVIFAVGQRPADTEDMELELLPGGFIRTEKGATSVPGVFAAGDVVTGTRSVIEAIAAGNAAADRIAAWLGDPLPAKPALSGPRPGYLGKLAGFVALERCAGTEGGEPLCPAAARAEAERCLQCDLRLDIQPQKSWVDFRKGGD